MITLAPDDNISPQMNISSQMITLAPDDIPDDKISSQMITLAPDDNISSQMKIFRPR
jgi:hypothetical protein